MMTHCRRALSCIWLLQENKENILCGFGGDIVSCGQPHPDSFNGVKGGVGADIYTFLRFSHHCFKASPQLHILLAGLKIGERYPFEFFLKIL